MYVSKNACINAILMNIIHEEAWWENTQSPTWIQAMSLAVFETSVD